MVTSPEPSRLTSALPVAFASTSTEPVFDTSSVCATMPSASTSPDPVMRNSADSAVPPSTSRRSEEHTCELQSLMRHSYADFCWKNKQVTHTNETKQNTTHTDNSL